MTHFRLAVVLKALHFSRVALGLEKMTSADGIIKNDWLHAIIDLR